MVAWLKHGEWLPGKYSGKLELGHHGSAGAGDRGLGNLWRARCRVRAGPPLLRPLTPINKPASAFLPIEKPLGFQAVFSLAFLKVQPRRRGMFLERPPNFQNLPGVAPHSLSQKPKPHELPNPINLRRRGMELRAKPQRGRAATEGQASVKRAAKPLGVPALAGAWIRSPPASMLSPAHPLALFTFHHFSLSAFLRSAFPFVPLDVIFENNTTFRLTPQRKAWNV